MIELPEDVQTTLRGRSFWVFATVGESGLPMATPVWVDFDGAYVEVNTAVGRQKERNVRHERRVALGWVDPDDPYHWIEIRGVVAELIEGEAAGDSIDRFARKYLGLGRDEAGVPRTDRVLVRIEPVAVSTRREPGPTTAESTER